MSGVVPHDTPPLEGIISLIISMGTRYHESYHQRTYINSWYVFIMFYHAFFIESNYAQTLTANISKLHFSLPWSIQNPKASLFAVRF